MEMPRIRVANDSSPSPRKTSEICIKCKRITAGGGKGSRMSVFRGAWRPPEPAASVRSATRAATRWTVPHGAGGEKGWEKRKGLPEPGGLSRDETGRLPTLPHSYPCSTIGAEELNCRVRDGNGWVLLAMVTQKAFGSAAFTRRAAFRRILTGFATKISAPLSCACSRCYGQAERAISNGQLNALLRLHIRPIKLVVYQCPS